MSSRAAVLTISTSLAAGEGEDVSGPALVRLCEEAGLEVRDDRVEIETEARTSGQTGVEMEALTAASVAALTVYDMVKGIEPGVVIERVELLDKTGGKADFHR